MQFDLTQFLVTEVFAYGIIFCRIGAAFMAVPGVGDAFVPARARLLFALTLSFLITPALKQNLPAVPTSPIITFLIIGSEILYGVFLGMMARVALSCMHTAGMVIATNAGLSAAMLFDPNQGSQGTALGNLLGLMAITLILSTDLHQYLLLSLTQSYNIFAPGEYSQMADFGPYFVKLAAKSFQIALQIAAPITVITIIINFTAGILARLMPSVQIFFIVMPAQMLVSFFVLTASISGIVMMFMKHFEDTFTNSIQIAPF